MLARVKFWMCINAYALLLDALSLTAIALSLCMFRTWLVLSLGVLLIGIYMFCGGIGIHMTYGEKCRIYALLVRRNAHGLRIESFRDFMSVPCHRLVVRMVLYRVGYSREYATVKRKFYVSPWRREFQTDTELVVFKTKEEGEAWLSHRGELGSIHG